MSDRPATELVALVSEPRGAALPDDCTAASFALADGGAALAITAPAPLIPAKRTQATLRRALGKAALLRQTRLEALAEQGIVLPAAPGTPRLAAPAAFATANAPVLSAAFARLAGRRQYQVRVEWRARAAPRRFAAAPEFGQMPRDAARAALARRLGEGITACLAEAATEAIGLPPGENGLANLALLVDDAERMALEAALERVDAVWTEGLRIRLVGPSPAVSFALARLEPVAPGAPAEAARLLGAASDETPCPELLARLRRRALASHGRPGAPSPDRIDRAVALLGACGRLGRAPVAAEPMPPLLSLGREGPPLAPRSDAAAALSEVA